jgi:outer membrane lipoprotein-sorting protein
MAKNALRSCRTLLCVMVAMAGYVSAPASQSLSVDEIVARNLAAKGGAERLRAVNSVKMTGRLKGPAGETKQSSWAKRPNLRRRETTSDGQTFVLGFDGKTVWAINPLVSQAPREITGPQADMTRQGTDDFDSPLLDYKAKGYTVDLVATESVQGISMHRLRVTSKTGAIQDIYLNAETMLESKIVMQLDQGGKKALVTSEFANYKSVDGINVPFHIRQVFNGKLMAEVFYDQVQFDVPMEDSLFTLAK